jgi:Protein of unknown function (DUF3352)
MTRLLLAITALTTAIAVAAGCGSDSTSSSGAASLAPADSLVYGEATLRPEGDQKAALEALVEKFPGEGSAGDRIGRLMEQAFAESDSGLSYKDDIEPWLGDEAGFFVSSVDPTGGDAAAALLVATDDEGQAEGAIEKGSKGEGREDSYEGHDYRVFPEDDGAAGVVDGWVVLGNPAGFKAAVDTMEGGEPIEEDEAFKRTLADAPDERLGFFYMNGPAFYEALQKSPAAAMLGPAFRQLFEEPLLATVNADDTGVRFEGTIPASLLAGIPIVSEGGGAAGELPADAWLAVAQPDLGKTIEAYVGLFAGAAGGPNVIEQQLRSSTGLDLQEDVISWMGDWGLFVRGTSTDDLNGALTIETTDEAASGRFIDAVVRLTRQNADPGTEIGPLELGAGGEGVTMRGPGLEQPLHLFQRDGRVVAAYGNSAARDALDPPETLGDSPAFTDAQAALGGDYDASFYFAIGPILQLIESTSAASDEEWQQVKPYLEPLGALVGGARKEGDKVHSAFGLTVK